MQRTYVEAIRRFKKIFNQIKASKVKEPTAMTLSSVAKNGQPSSRVVLLKEASEDGFVFYTNHQSRKAAELYQNPRAALSHRRSARRS